MRGAQALSNQHLLKENVAAIFLHCRANACVQQFLWRLEVRRSANDGGSRQCKEEEEEEGALTLMVAVISSSSSVTAVS